jgi:hypothetical protein
MILFDPINDAIVTAFAKERKLSTQDLHSAVSIVRPISLPNFYKVVKKLVADQILIKENGLLSLHGRWILGLSALVDDLQKASGGTASTEVELREGEIATYGASNLEDLDGLWGDLMLSVNRICGPKETTFVYQAHPYYALGMAETEMEFFRQEKTVSPVRFLTGNATVLDFHGAKAYQGEGISSVATTDVPFPREGYCVTVIGDYVFEVIYPAMVSEFFRFFFNTTEKFEDFNSELFRKGFKMNARCRLTLRRDKKNAEKIRNGFLRAMGE